MSSETSTRRIIRLRDAARCKDIQNALSVAAKYASLPNLIDRSEVKKLQTELEDIKNRHGGAVPQGGDL